MPGRDDVLGIDAARLNDLADLHDRLRCGHRHQRSEVAPRHPVGEIAHCVAEMRLDQRNIRLEPALLHIGSTLEHLDRFTLCQVGPERGRRIKGRDARAAGRMRSASVPCGTNSSSISPQDRGR